MGLNADIYKANGRSFSSGGLSESHDRVCIVNVSGPSEPTDDSPAVMLVPGNLSGTVKIVPAVLFAGTGPYVPANLRGAVGPMMGGCYVGTSDSRLGEAICEITGQSFASGMVPLHDRFETPEQYRALSA